MVGRPTCTLREQCQLPKCLGGGSRTGKDRYGPADIAALLPNAGWLSPHVRPHQREVCSLAGGVMSPHGSTPGRPITGRPSLAPSSFTRRLISSPCETPSLTGRRRAYHVPPLSPCGLGRASPLVVRQLRRRSSEPPDLTTYLLVQAIQHLALGLCDDVYRRFTCVDPTTQSWFPTAVMLAVATAPHG